MLRFFMRKPGRQDSVALTSAARRARIAVPLAILALASALPGAGAASSVTAVDATFVVTQPSLDRLDLLGVLLVHAYALDGRQASAQELASAALRGQPGALATLEAAARRDVADALARAYPDARVLIGSATVDAPSLAAAAEARGPIRLTLGAVVERAPDDLALLDERAARAALAAGARWTMSMELPAPAGYLVTYVVRAPGAAPGLAVVGAPGGTFEPDGSAAVFLVDNRGGAAARHEHARITVAQPGAPVAAREELVQQVELRLGAPDADAGGVPLDVLVTLELRALDVAQAFPSLLPAELHLPFATSDGLRGLHRGGLIGERELAALEADLLDRLRPWLASVLPGAELSGGILRADLERGAAPGAPIRFVATARGEPPVAPDAAREAEAALAIGAVLRVDLPLEGGPYGTTYVIHPPARTLVASTEDAPGASQTRFVVAAGAPLAATTLRLRSADAPVLLAQDTAVDVRVDLQDIAFSLRTPGDRELRGEVAASLQLRVVDLPAALRAQLGEDVDLRFVSSDGIRLLVERGLLDERELADALGEAAREPIESALGVPLTDVTMETQGVAGSVEPGAPITFLLRGRFALPLQHDAPQTQAGIALYTQTQTFRFAAAEGADVRYTIVLPRGLALAGLAIEGGDELAWDAPRGRDGFSLRPGPGGADAVATLAVTPGFLVAHFGGLLAGAGLALAAAVAAPALLARARRRALARGRADARRSR